MPARTFEIRVLGEIAGADLLELPDLDATREPAQTVLRGCIPDQAALHGVLQRLHSLGLELVEVRQLPPDIAMPPAAEAPS